MHWFKKFFILTFGVVILIFTIYYLLSTVYAATNIDSVYRYAWNDLIGWIDFYSTGNVNVSSTQLIGYASSSVGFIALDCATTPNGNVCGTSNFKVSNDGSGNLSGWAWNDSIGWISFDSATAGSLYPYQVIINSSTGDFSGWAWNDSIGWISFNCNNSGAGGCSSGDYKVKTSLVSTSTSAVLISSVFDSFGSSTINSIIWQGTQLSGTAVKFQLASSNNLSGPWNYMGPDGSDTTYYLAGPGVSMAVNAANHNNKKYFRYKVILTSNSSAITPIVNNIIISWSP